MDILNYLNGQQSTFLKSATYNMGSKTDKHVEIIMNDAVDAKLTNNGIEVIFTRDLNMGEESTFRVEVCMGCYLYFNQDNSNEISWSEVDLVQEIKDCPIILNKLIARSSLLIAQLTSSFGGNPIVTPPQLIEPQDKDN